MENEMFDRRVWVRLVGIVVLLVGLVGRWSGVGGFFMAAGWWFG